MIGTFPANENNEPDEEESMMMCDYEYGSSSVDSQPQSSCFEQNNSLGNDFCPHSTQLCPLMECDESTPLSLPSLRKQTAVSCLAALTNDYEGSHSSHTSEGSQREGNSFGLLVCEDSPEDEQWGQFAHHEADVSSSSLAMNHALRLTSRRRSHQRRRTPAKYGRGNASGSPAWRN